MLRSIDHFIGGSSFASGERQGEVFDPNQGQVQAHVRFGTAADLQKAVDAAKAAQPEWAATNPQRRARVMFAFKALVEANMEDLALLLASEPLDRVTGRVTYSQQILKEFGWISEGRGRGVDSRGSGYSEI